MEKRGSERISLIRARHLALQARNRASSELAESFSVMDATLEVEMGAAETLREAACPAAVPVIRADANDAYASGPGAAYLVTRAVAEA